MNLLSTDTVLVTTADLQAMRRVWPCSGLPYDGYCLSFEFDARGNLVDIEWYTDEGLDVTEPDGVDGACMVTLSHDARKFLNDYLVAHADHETRLAWAEQAQGVE